MHHWSAHTQLFFARYILRVGKSHKRAFVFTNEAWLITIIMDMRYMIYTVLVIAIVAVNCEGKSLQKKQFSDELEYNLRDLKQTANEKRNEQLLDQPLFSLRELKSVLAHKRILYFISMKSSIFFPMNFNYEILKIS